MDGQRVECRRTGFVSASMARFLPWKPRKRISGSPMRSAISSSEAFARDLGVDEQLLEKLEVNFERMSPRPLRELLNDATFSGAFRDQAVEAASRFGISSAQGIALVYDFD